MDKELLTKLKFKDDNPISSISEWVNELTDEMDKHLLHPEYRVLRTYITLPRHPNIDVFDPDKKIDESINRRCAIRVPGATRGGIEVDKDNVVISINLCQDSCFGMLGCYKKSVIEAVKKYIGYKLIFDKDEGM